MRRRFYGSPPINFNPLHPAPALPKPHYPLKIANTLALPASCGFSLPPHQKIIPRLLSGRKCSGVVESCLLCWFRIVRNFGQALSRILAFAVVGVGASLRRLCAPPSCILARRACSVGFASLRNFGRSFYKASMPYPQVAGSPSPSTKNNTPLVERAKV